MASYSPVHHFSEADFSSSTLFWGRFFFCPLFWGKFFFCTILTVLLFAEHIFSFCEKVLSCWYIWTTKRKLNSGAFQRWIGRERCKNGWRTEIEMEMQTSKTKIFSQSLQEDFIFFSNLMSTLITFEHVEKYNQWLAYFWEGLPYMKGVDTSDPLSAQIIFCVFKVTTDRPTLKMNWTEHCGNGQQDQLWPEI